MDYIDPALSSMVLHDDVPGFKQATNIRFSGSENYSVARIEASTDTYSDEDIYFAQLDGENLPLDTETVQSYLNTIATLDLLEYVTYNATEEELQACGLDAPELSVSIDYTYTDENGEETADTFLFHISRSPEEQRAAEEAEANGEEPGAVSKYIRIGGSQIVYRLDDADYETLAAASYNDLRHKEVIWADFADVYQIDITLEGAQHTLTSTLEDTARVWRYARDAGGADGAETAPADTEEALDIQDLQSALEALRAEEFTLEEPSGKEEIRLTVYLEKENHPKVEIALYRYDGAQCLAVVDGEPVCLVSRSSVMDLVEAVQAIVL